MLRPLTIALTLLAAPALAQNVAFGGMTADTSAPVEVAADNLAVDQADGSAVFTGNVVIGQGEMRLFQVYSAGNYIEATEDTPFLQIGEHKYGKPIIDRALHYDTPLDDGLKLALISMDSTMRSNLSVGMPIDLMVYRRDALKVAMTRRISEDDEYFRGLRQSWSDALTKAYRAIPEPGWEF